jgi:4-hydroxyacetophenone monooxygenase
MCLYHLTGDDTWLEPPYQPVRDVRLIADPGAGFAPDIQAKIRDAACRLLESGAPSPRVENPDNEVLHRMMDVCLGEEVDPAYVPMIREDMGFSSGDAAWTTTDGGRRREQSVLIVGAGLAGLALAVHLERLGIPYILVEKNDDVGGTWLENRYPGCRVDTPNHFYSYSFAPNHGWSHYFSVRAEIHRYIRWCADTFGVRRRVRFQTRLTAATWDESRQQWRATVEGAGGVEHVDADVLVSAIGQVNLPAIPSIPGMEAFRGPLFHSACWPEALEVAGKRVAVVGTGASSMQIVPTIADEVASLTVYQRSPQWARPVAEYRQEVKPGTQWLLGNVPFYAAWNRFTLMWRYGDGLLRFLRKDPDWPHPERITFAHSNDGSLYVGLNRHVGTDEVDSPVVLPSSQFGDERLAALDVQIRRHDVPAVVQEPLHRGPADAAGAAGHQRREPLVHVGPSLSTDRQRGLPLEV